MEYPLSTRERVKRGVSKLLRKVLLWKLMTPPDGGTTEESVSLEEALRRERQRQRELGATKYAWVRKGNRILAPMGVSHRASRQRCGRRGHPGRPPLPSRFRRDHQTSNGANRGAGSDRRRALAGGSGPGRSRTGWDLWRELRGLYGGDVSGSGAGRVQGGGGHSAGDAL